MSSRLMPAPQDGRAFTSYLSAGLAEDALQRRFGVTNEQQYRQYLQHNSTRVAEQLRALHYIGAVPVVRPRPL